MREIITETVKILNKDGVILYPTDTIWGIGCNALSEKAVEKVYAIKQRDRLKSMLILVDSVEMLERYVNQIPSTALQLIEAATSPLTIIYSGAKGIAQNLIAADNTIGIRITKDEFCKNLIHEFGKPIVSTSANLAGSKPPLGYFDINNEIKISVEYIVPLRLEELNTSKSSDIIRVLRNGQIEIIR